MIIDIAKIFLGIYTQGWHTSTKQFAAGFHQWCDCMFDHHDLALELVQTLDVGAFTAFGENLFFDEFQFFFQGFLIFCVLCAD